MWEEFAGSLPEDYQQFIGLEQEAASIAIWHVDVVVPAADRSVRAAHHRQLQPVEPVPPGMVGRWSGPHATPASAGREDLRCRGTR